MNAVNNKTTLLTDLFNDSRLACTLAGQANEISGKAKNQQLSYIRSEVQELSDALFESDLVEELDACVDILVTVFGYMVKLQNQGADLSLACKLVAENNLTKFPESEAVVDETIAFYKETKGITCTKHYNPLYNKWVIRDENGKYRKPSTFVDVDLSVCFPSGK